jgi:hypothetical protein
VNPARKVRGQRRTEVCRVVADDVGDKHEPRTAHIQYGDAQDGVS